MTLQFVPLSSLQPPKGNPRTAIDPDSLEGLADSIRTDGLLQNLVVTRLKGRGERYRIVSGERRFRALKLLEERAEITGDYAVPVEIRNKLSADDTLRLATVENLQRENLPPLDEAAAFAALVKDGVRLDDLAARTGLSPATIKRRLALNGLCGEARDLLLEGTITLAQAESLTLGGPDDQQRVLEAMAQGYHYDAEDIRESLAGGKPSAALGVFPLERYRGSFTTDLFADEETTYFDDVEQFFSLQREAVEELVAHHRELADWAELTEHYTLRHWLYDEAEDGVPSGVVINLSPSGRVEIRDGLVRPDATPDPEAASAEAPVVKPRPAYSRPVCAYIAWHKSMAVQEMLLADPRKAKEVAVARMLGRVDAHPCLEALAGLADPQAAYDAVEEQAATFVKALGLDDDDATPAWIALSDSCGSTLSAYEAAQALSDEALDRLLALLSVLSFGQADCGKLDTSENLFTRVAQDLGVDLRRCWRPDRYFLERRNKDQLIAIAGECGFAEGHGLLRGWKKSELVEGLLRHFEHARDAAEPTAAQDRALNWLPGVMHFPALDPDAPEAGGTIEEPDFAEAA